MIKLLKLLLLTSFLSTAWAAEDNSIIIDVRTTDEWQAGHLQSAKHLPLDRVEAEITELVADKIPRCISTAEAATGRVKRRQFWTVLVIARPSMPAE